MLSFIVLWAPILVHDILILVQVEVGDKFFFTLTILYLISFPSWASWSTSRSAQDSLWNHNITIIVNNYPSKTCPIKRLIIFSAEPTPVYPSTTNLFLSFGTTNVFSKWNVRHVQVGYKFTRIAEHTALVNPIVDAIFYLCLYRKAQKELVSAFSCCTSAPSLWRSLTLQFQINGGMTLY